MRKEKSVLLATGIAASLAALPAHDALHDADGVHGRRGIATHLWGDVTVRKANRGDRSALAELEEVLDRHPEVWQTAARLSADTAAGWARLLSDGGAVTEACLRRELQVWKTGLASPDPSPLVTAAVDAAGVAWLAQRFAERELFTAGDKGKAAAVRQLVMGNRQLQDAIKLVLAARAVADAAANRATDHHKVAAGPRLFDGAAG